MPEVAEQKNIMQSVLGRRHLYNLYFGKTFPVLFACECVVAWVQFILLNIIILQDTCIFKCLLLVCIKHIVSHLFPPALTRLPLVMCNEHKRWGGTQGGGEGKMVQILKAKPKCFAQWDFPLHQVPITRSWMFTFGEWSLVLASGSLEEMSLDSL